MATLETTQNGMALREGTTIRDVLQALEPTLLEQRIELHDMEDEDEVEGACVAMSTPGDVIKLEHGRLHLRLTLSGEVLLPWVRRDIIGNLRPLAATTAEEAALVFTQAEATPAIKPAARRTP